MRCWDVYTFEYINNVYAVCLTPNNWVNCWRFVYYAGVWLTFIHIIHLFSPSVCILLLGTKINVIMLHQGVGWWMTYGHP